MLGKRGRGITRITCIKYMEITGRVLKRWILRKRGGGRARMTCIKHKEITGRVLESWILRKRGRGGTRMRLIWIQTEQQKIDINGKKLSGCYMTSHQVKILEDDAGLLQLGSVQDVARNECYTESRWCFNNKHKTSNHVLMEILRMRSENLRPCSMCNEVDLITDLTN